MFSTAENVGKRTDTSKTTILSKVAVTPFFQPKLTINSPGDKYEQEADAMADMVMRMPTTESFTAQKTKFSALPKNYQQKPITSSLLQRKCTECAQEEEDLQRKEIDHGDSGGKIAPSSVGKFLASAGGHAMDNDTQQFMESRFGQDFSSVRIHSDSKATQSAAALQARAYTSGKDIVFGAGEYQPGSDQGKRLLAHELTHVLQQKNSLKHSPSLQRQTQSEAIEHQQPWSQHILNEPVIAPDEGVRRALEANLSLGLSNRVIGLISQRLGLGLRHPRINRAFVIALREFQHAQPRNLDAGEETPVEATGILDLPSVFGLNLGASDEFRATRESDIEYYRRRSTADTLGLTLDEPGLRSFKTNLSQHIPIGERDLQLRQVEIPARRRRPASTRVELAVTEHFIAQIINWNIWHHRHARTFNARLSAEDWALLRQAQAAPSTLTDPPAFDSEPLTTVTQAPVPSDPVDSAAETIQSTRDEILPVEELVNPLTEREIADLNDLKTELNLYLSLRHQYRRQEARKAQLDRDFRATITAYQGILHFPESFWSRPSGFSDSNYARRLKNRINAILRDNQWEIGLEAVERSSTRRRQPTALSREQAIEFLRIRNQVLGQGNVTREGWDTRLAQDRRTGMSIEVETLARRAVEDLEQLRAQFATYKNEISRVIDAPQATELVLRTALDRLFLFAETVQVPTTVRNQWQPIFPNRPRNFASLQQAGLSGLAIRWRNSLSRNIQQINTEIARNQTYARPISRTFHYTQVDLNRSGVEVLWGNGNPVPASEMRLDPVFAVAMFNFLEYLHGIGVTQLWTAGFSRSGGHFMSIHDTHSLGQSCDITGFKFGDGPTSHENLIHLRSGYPLPEDHPNYAHYQRGHSDWFDHHTTIGTRTHRQIILGIAESMPRFFGRIVSPGHNPEHMAHFHVELTGTQGSPLIFGTSEYRDMPEWVQSRASSRDPGWDQIETQSTEISTQTELESSTP